MSQAIDFDGMRSYLEETKKTPKFVKRGIIISHDEIKKLISFREEFGKTAVSKCYERGEMHFIVDAKCSGITERQWSNNKIAEFRIEGCGKHFLMDLGTTKFEEYVKCQNVLCLECRDAIDEKQNAQRKIQEQKNQEEEKKRIEHYKENFLSPTRSWFKETPMKDRWNAINCSREFGEGKELTEHIKQMSYVDFLKTPYWSAVASRTKYKANYRCQLCNSNESLQTHHRTYANHGCEHLFLQDLIVLCKDCHEKHHDKQKI